MTRRLRVQVCIVGAGPVGGALACNLASAGVNVALIDRSELALMEAPSFDGRAYAVAAGSRGLLQEAGLWQALRLSPHPIRDIWVSDGRVGRSPSRSQLRFDSRQASGPPRPFGWMVEARTLRQALNDRFRSQPNLTVFAPAQARVERSEAGASVSVGDEQVIESQLVVAAEGRSSLLRTQAGIAVTHISYDQTAMVCAVAHEFPHYDLALEHFLPAGPFAVLPMSPSADALPEGAEHVSAIVWTERTAQATVMLKLEDARFTREVARRLGSRLGAIRTVGRRWNYSLSAMIAHRYVDTRLALIGDAAHGIHPIAGQGLNLGFRDGIALAELIKNGAAGGGDVGSQALLNHYQRMRRGDNLLMFAATDGLDRLFSSDLNLLRRARDAGTGMVDKLTPLKQFFVSRASGEGAGR